MADLLFVLFGFSYFAFAELVTDLLVCLNPNQSNRRYSVTSPYEVSECSLVQLMENSR